MMDRLPDWLPRLNDWVERARVRQFRWGEWDCVSAASDCAQSITGENPLEGLRWDGLKGALRQLDIEGGLAAAVTRVLGDPIDPRLAPRGDVLLMPAEDMPGGAVLNVCLGSTACGPGKDGLIVRPLFDGETMLATAAWKVGRG
jgi:hypothetical protein